MEPWDIVPSVGTSPFAVRTLQGWVINEPLDIAGRDDVSNSFASVNQIRNNFNHDFNERAIDDCLEPSKEDKQFLHVVSESATLINGHYVLDLPLRDRNITMPNNNKKNKLSKD